MDLQKSRIDKVLNLDFNADEGIWIRNGYSLRKLIGILGMSLPILLILISLTSFGLDSPLESISHYYYTRASPIFAIVVSQIAIFLIVYSGKETIDFYISTLAGICAILLILFPTSNLAEVCCDPVTSYAVTYFEGSGFRETFHLICAAIFIGLLAAMSFFIFTKSDKPRQSRGKAKITRNRIYRTSAALILISLIVMFLGVLEVIPPDFYDSNNLTFWMETLAVESFGFSWLIKGETFFKDR